MGGSIRRRRGGRRPKNSGGTRSFLLALGVVLLGSGSGYLYATQVVFPSERGLGPELTEVPDLRGMTAAEALFTLDTRGFEPGQVDSIRHPQAPAGQVVGQSPLPGQGALPGARVELTVSLGAEQRPVPDVSRLRVDRALTVLRTSGFEVEVDSIEANEPEGQVVSTLPEAGTRLTLPANVRMTVSLGPPLLELPDLVGLQEEEARAILAELGLEVGEVENRARFGFGQGDVLETFPVAGEMVPRGGAVRLVVRRRSALPGGEGP
jgi:eukaryotic-like serine/threonine-protein kinase